MQKTLTRPQQITTEIVTVTPDMAKAWLEKNEHNRESANATIAKFARDMRNGNWRLTGDAIRFDVTGRLLDGQHRLMACLRAGEAFQTLVIYGLDPLTQDVMDTGKVRRTADVLSLRGITNANMLSTTLRTFSAFREGIYVARTAPLTTSDATDLFESHPNITKSVTAVTGGMPKSSPRSAIAMVHYLATFYLKDADNANRMVQVFRTGIPSYEGDVMHVLRERFIRFTSSNERIRQEVAAHTVHYAWNLFAKQKTVGVLRWQNTFVEIDGIDRTTL